MCGVGRDGQGRTLVVLWDTAQLRSTGDVSVLTKAHTENSIHTMRVADFESHRSGSGQGRGGEVMRSGD